MDDKLLMVYRPVLDYLAKANEVRSKSELDQYFGKKGLVFSTNLPLLDKGIIIQTTAPTRLTSKSKVQMDEPAYYFNDILTEKNNPASDNQ